MYKKQVEHMLNRFDEAKRYIKSHVKLEPLLRGMGSDKVAFCKDFEENSDLLKKIALYLAKQVTKTEAASYSYAAAIAYIAEELGYSDYVIYGGLAVNTEKNQKLYAKVKDEKFDANHVPYMANYVYIKVGDIEYDYYEGFENIEHIYMEKIA